MYLYKIYLKISEINFDKIVFKIKLGFYYDFEQTFCFIS